MFPRNETRIKSIGNFLKMVLSSDVITLTYNIVVDWCKILLYANEMQNKCLYFISYVLMYVYLM